MALLLVLSIFLHTAGTPAMDKVGALVSGPMPGYQAHHEGLIWVKPKNAGNVTPFILARRHTRHGPGIGQTTRESRSPCGPLMRFVLSCAG